MKVFKKILSAAVASVMCIPSSIVNMAYATGTGTENGYTVTLTDADNGIMQFSAACMEASTATQDGYHMIQIDEDGNVEDVENDGSIWAFSKGNEVEIELIPDSGYEVSSFSIKNAETGNVLAHEDTTDNVFSFVMPAKNVMVEAGFAEQEEMETGTCEEENVEDTNIIEENADGQTVYRRIELTDEDAVTLQKEINKLPDAAELYSTFVSEGYDYLSELENEADALSDTYFNEFSDEQRAQVNPSLLFSTLLMTKTSELVSESDITATDEEIAELQERIDKLADVNTIAAVTNVDDDTDNAVYGYGENGEELYISNNQQDELFAEVLELSDITNNLVPECARKLDVNKLAKLEDFFTNGYMEDSAGEAVVSYADVETLQAYEDLGLFSGGLTTSEDGEIVLLSNSGDGVKELVNNSANGIMAYAENPNAGIMLFDEGGTDYSGGWYMAKMHKAYRSSFFAGVAGDKPCIMFCGNAKYRAGSKNSQPIYFANAEELTADDTAEKVQLVRKILYYGFMAPGMVDGIYTIELSNSAYETIDVGPITLDAGWKVQQYMVTHFALCEVWSGECGDGPVKAPEYQEYLEKIKGLPDPPADFKVFFTDAGNRTQPIFYFLLDTIVPHKARDPFNIWLFKTNNQLGYENETATLAGAEFTVTYYAAEENEDGTTNLESLIHTYEAASQIGTAPTATFTFETKIIEPNFNSPKPGSERFQLLASILAQSHKYVAGIETRPLDPTNPEGWENQFLTSSIDDYRNYFGGAGSYHIRETKASQGFDLSGTMTVPKGGGDEYVTTSLQKGVVISLAFTEFAENGTVSKSSYYLNGNEIDSDGEIQMTVTNPLDPDDEKEVTFPLDNNAVIYVDEKPQASRLWTTAMSIDTGTQWVDPNSSNIYLEDSINVETFTELEAKYIIDTRLFDKTAGSFISFNNGYGAVNADTPNQSKVPNPYKTPAGRVPNVPAGFMSYFGTGQDAPNGIITTTFNTKTSVEPGQTYNFKVRASINGDGLEGHTLVFINTLTVLNGANGDVPINYKGTQYLVYQYPTDRLDTDTTVKGTSKLNQIQTMMQDTKEMIYITRSSTNIISSQTKRKRDDRNNRGESIIYAGMYLDGSFTSGGGAIKQTLTDTVHYENLQPNRTYYVKGYLVDKGTGTLAVDANGTPIQNTENTIKQQSSGSGSGDWKIEYSFDATGCGNRVYVSFVEVYLADELVLEYKNVNDIDEAFYIPEITTKLWDHKTGVDVTYAEETVTVHDTITYKKFLPNTRYKIESRLVNMETGETLLDVNGNPVIKETTKIITWEDGEITVDLEFPAVIRDDKGDIVKSLAGTIFVAYEKIYIEQGSEGSGRWVLVADHEDFWDEDQRIYMPYIDTTALDQKTEEHISYAEKNMKLYDTVHYEAVRPEYTYKLVSELRDVATGGIVVDDAGKKQVITTYFKADFDLQDNQYLTYGDIIPENHDGSGITFDVDAEFFAGRTLVVYERMYLENDYGTGSHLVAEHQQLLDEDQTIHVPKVWTSAIDADTFTKTSFADGSTTIIDTFSYENLIPGFTYELKGYVLDKNQSITTGTNVTATGTDGKIAQNSTVFTPESSAGTVYSLRIQINFHSLIIF